MVNIHVVGASASIKALSASNPSETQKRHDFSMPCSWVYSVYKCLGYGGTTTCPPVCTSMTLRLGACGRDYRGFEDPDKCCSYFIDQDSEPGKLELGVW